MSLPRFAELPDVIWWGGGSTTSVADFADFRSLVTLGMTSNLIRDMASEKGLLLVKARSELRRVLLSSLTTREPIEGSSSSECPIELDTPIAWKKLKEVRDAARSARELFGCTSDAQDAAEKALAAATGADKIVAKKRLQEADEAAEAAEAAHAKALAYLQSLSCRPQNHSSVASEGALELVPVPVTDLAAAAAARMVLQRAMRPAEIEWLACELYKLAKLYVTAPKRAGSWMAFVELLVSGADPDAVGKEGTTALHWIAMSNRADLAAFVLAAGASPLYYDHAGYQPLDYRPSNEASRLFGDVGVSPDDELARQGVSCTAVMTAYGAIKAHNTDTRFGVKGEMIATQEAQMAASRRSANIIRALREMDIQKFEAELPVVTSTLACGDRVRALRDSAYTSWRRAGDVGTVTQVGDNEVVVSWDAHAGKTTPFDSTNPLINWQRLLVLESRSEQPINQSTASDASSTTDDICACAAASSAAEESSMESEKSGAGTLPSHGPSVASACAGDDAAPSPHESDEYDHRLHGLDLFEPKPNEEGKLSTEQLYLFKLLESGFASAASHDIERAVRTTGPYRPQTEESELSKASCMLAGWRTESCITRSLCAVEANNSVSCVYDEVSGGNWGQIAPTMHAGVIYRTTVLRHNDPSSSDPRGSSASAARALRARAMRKLLIVEVLFMATHPLAKRRGLATRLVSALKQRAVEMEAALRGLDGSPDRCAAVSTALCVSLKSHSSEARGFWTRQGLGPLQRPPTSSCMGNRPASASDAIVESMIPFADFTPFGAIISGAADVAGGACPSSIVQPGAAASGWLGTAHSLLAALKNEAEAYESRLWSERIEQRTAFDDNFVEVVELMGQQPIDGPHITRRLDAGGYSDLRSFCADVRSLLATALAFSCCEDLEEDTEIVNAARSPPRLRSARSVQGGKLRRERRKRQRLKRQAIRAQLWLVNDVEPLSKLPPTEYKQCQAILEDLYSVEGAAFFGFPVVTYFPKDDPTRFTYLSEVANPLDLGTIAVRLHTGFYDSCADFAADVDTMVGNCLSYWGAEQRGGSENPAGQCYMQSATAMQQHVAQCLHGSLPHVA